VTTPYLRYDTRDSFIRPTQGWLSTLGLDISKGIENSLDDFVKYRFDTRYFYSPIKGLTLAWLARLEQLFPYGDNRTVPEDQLLFLGGVNDVRGFEENLLRFDDKGDPAGGKSALVSGIEARIDLMWNLELTAFFDTGSVQDAINGGGSDQWRSSVGLGLRYITPIGPIGLLYGHKLDPKEGEAPGRIHLSIGYTF
jgi:outer membrane protein insertion porin family